MSLLVMVRTYEEMPTGARGKLENALQSSGVNDSCPPSTGTVLTAPTTTGTWRDTRKRATRQHGEKQHRCIHDLSEETLTCSRPKKIQQTHKKAHDGRVLTANKKEKRGKQKESNTSTRRETTPRMHSKHEGNAPAARPLYTQLPQKDRKIHNMKQNPQVSA